MLPFILASMCALLISSRVDAEEIIVVISKDNNAERMTRSQVIDLFMGKYVAFPDGSKAQPLDSDDSFKSQFYKALVGMPVARVNAYWSRIKFTGRARPPLAKESSDDVIAYIIENAHAIGYIPSSKLNDQLKVVYQLK